SLVPSGGTRQIDVDLRDGLDLTPGSSGTRYYASNSHVISVSADGLITAVGPGEATVTVIHGAAESLVEVRVADPLTGAVLVDETGAVIGGSDGSLVQVAPGALTAPTTISVNSVSESNLPLPVPSFLNFASAFQLELGDDPLLQPAQVAIPAP